MSGVPPDYVMPDYRMTVRFAFRFAINRKDFDNEKLWLVSEQRAYVFIVTLVVEEGFMGSIEQVLSG